MSTQNFFKLSATVHKLSYTQTSLSYLAMVKNLKIQSHDLDVEILWVSSGCQGICSRTSSWSKAQQFMSYRGHRKNWRK